MRLIALSLLLTLAACGAPAAVLPTSTPLVQTVVVTEVVEVEVTVVVTATLPPATATAAATSTPEPPPLALRDVAEFRTSPGNEIDAAELPPGTGLEPISQVEGWVEVRVAGQVGWVRTELIDGDVSGVPAYADALVVSDGEIVQDFLADSVIFKGKLLNLGGATARQVQLEFELLDAAGSRLELITGYVDTIDIPPGQSVPFSVIGDDVSGWETYVYGWRWDE